MEKVKIEVNHDNVTVNALWAGIAASKQLEFNMEYGMPEKYIYANMEVILTLATLFIEEWYTLGIVSATFDY